MCRDKGGKIKSGEIKKIKGQGRRIDSMRTQIAGNSEQGSEKVVKIVLALILIIGEIGSLVQR